MADSTRPAKDGNRDEDCRAKKAAYGKRYYAANRERILAKCKKYRDRTKAAKKARDKAYYEANKDKWVARSRRQDVRDARANRYRELASDPKRLEKKRQLDRIYSKQYRERHPDRRKQIQKKYRTNNPDACRASAQKCIAKDPEKYRKAAAQKSRKHRAAFVQKNGACYSTLRRKRDAQFAMALALRSRVGVALSRQNAQKSNRTLKLVGCTTSELMAYLESKFSPGMSWENRGEWHIDHIVPLAAFDLSDIDQQHKAFHFTNLQPLWATDNLRKSSKVPGQHPFGFAYAARIAEGDRPRLRRRAKSGARQHGND